jgi:hypothetical protein
MKAKIVFEFNELDDIFENIEVSDGECCKKAEEKDQQA